MKHNPFHYRIVKARLAETLIKELFKINNYNVFGFGVEQSLSGLESSLHKSHSPEALQIRQQPDFVVQNTLDGTLHYVEVKYRHNGVFKRDELAKDFSYQNAYFIIVHKKGIRCIAFEELDKLGYLPEDNKYCLGQSNDFSLSKESIDEFLCYASMFFNGVE
jgi:hypothetical protein